MCLILDANVCTDVLKKNPNSPYQKLIRAVFDNQVLLIHGGQLTDEYRQAGVLGIIATLAQSGRAIRVSDELIQAEIQRIRGRCKSNDEHVIALARADRKRARVLCSNDQDLRTDFKNKTLINKPRGAIYSPKNHVASLRHCK